MTDPSPHPEATMPTHTPTAFISYSWDSNDYKDWVRDLATRLRNDGVDVTLDQWHAVPGDRLPHFMERAIQRNDYVLILCTPQYRQKSDERTGGVGYEGDIMTGEVYDLRNERKFIPLLTSGTWSTAIPAWLKGKYGIDLSTQAKFPQGYNDLLTTLHKTRNAPPPLGPKPTATTPPAPITAQLITILGVVADEVTEPQRGLHQGSALYRVPFRLSSTPANLWTELFLQAWNNPPQFTTMHRPGIATVTGDKIILDGTTIEEVERYHRDTLMLCVKIANEQDAQVRERRQRDEDQRATSTNAHRTKIAAISRRIKFE